MSSSEQSSLGEYFHNADRAQQQAPPTTPTPTLLPSVLPSMPTFILSPSAALPSVTLLSGASVPAPIAKRVIPKGLDDYLDSAELDRMSGLIAAPTSPMTIGVRPTSPAMSPSSAWTRAMSPASHRPLSPCLSGTSPARLQCQQGQQQQQHPQALQLQEGQKQTSPKGMPCLGPACSPPVTPLGTPMLAVSPMLSMPRRSVSPCVEPEKKRVLDSRPATWAGKRYPANSLTLSAQLRDFLQQGPVMRPAKLVLVPHGPFETCGALMASSFRAIPRNTATIIVIAPAHRRGASPCCVTSFGALETPVGVLAVDMIASAALRDTGAFEVVSPNDDLEEYSVEMTLPFLQVVAPNAMVVPVLVGDCSVEQAKACGRALAAVARSRNTVIVLSCDFAHWGERYRWTKIDPRFGTGEPAIRATVSELDRCLIDLVTSGDPDAVCAHPWRHSLCRHNAVALALYTTQAAGWRLTASLASHVVVAGAANTYQGHASITWHQSTTS